MDNETPGRVDVTFEEMEQGVAVETPKKPEEIVLNAEGLPEDIKGKTAAEVVEHIKRLKEALVTSEEARKAAVTPPSATPAAPAPAAPVPEPEMTKEQLEELFRNDPLTAIAKMQETALKRIEANVDRRLGVLVGGTVSTAESEARRKYPDEFQLFGDQIATMVAQLPDKSAMTQSKSWDDLVSYIRGQPQNLDKLFEHRNAKARLEDARRDQAAAAGPSNVAAMRSAPPTPTSGLDATEREIAKGLGMSETEYLKWKGLR